MNTRAGLKAGILCSGMMMVVFLEMLRAVFSERCFDNEAAETAEIYVFTVGKRVFHYFHEPLDCGEDSGFVDARAFVDFVDNVGFCHCCEFI